MNPNLATTLTADLTAQNFAPALINWQRAHGRHHLPWQVKQEAYPIWVSEVMLQQTQVKTVVQYFARFMQRFPSIAALAQADWEQVAIYWSGLGYYARARHLHQATQLLMADYNGVLPQDTAALQRLPGIGRTTAAAIAVFAYGAHAAILDGNVKRVLTRVVKVSGTGALLEKKLWPLADALLPPITGNSPHDAAHIRSYTQGLMDLGSLVCLKRAPLCTHCPLQTMCGAFQSQQVDAYPTRKVPVALPQKYSRFVLPIDTAPDGSLQLHLVQRPSRGIWSGLYTPLEQYVFAATPPKALPRTVMAAHRVKANKAETAPMASHESVAPIRALIHHSFTHFSVEIELVCLSPTECRRLFPDLMPPSTPLIQWPLTAIGDAPLPAPFKKWLTSPSAQQAICNVKH